MNDQHARSGRAMHSTLLCLILYQVTTGWIAAAWMVIAMASLVLAVICRLEEG